MFSYNDKPILEYWKLRKIAKEVRHGGKVPRGVPKERIFEALRVTKPKNATEMFGFLSATVHNPDGTLKEDRGVVSVKLVTQAFCKKVVDALLTSGHILNDFNQHKQGSGSTAEATDQTALVVAQSGAQAATGYVAQTHGASSQIFRTIGTITATTNYEIREHGVFNASTGGVLLDRSVVTGISVNTDDVVTWTYELTVTAGG